MKVKSQSAYQEFEAVSLYCPHCRRAMPVKKRLLLILPEGDKYEYYCMSCSHPIGAKLDKRQSPSIVFPLG
ncbi:MAG: hypothetical protein AMJ45_01365 [Syntrophobacter sp. DG_60]|nr:MAG: hypothetical protein AMJ45_01365 [Syntrophobacter sp. DG_60]